MNVQIQPSLGVTSSPDELQQAQENHAEVAHATVRNARELLVQAEQRLREAARQASTAHVGAQEAQATLAAKEEIFEEKIAQPMTDEEREALQWELHSAREETQGVLEQAQQLGWEVDDAERELEAAQRKLGEAEGRANRMLSELGLPSAYRTLLKDPNRFQDGGRSTASFLSDQDAARLFSAERRVSARQAASFGARRVANATATQTAYGAVVLAEQLAASEDPRYRAELLTQLEEPLAQLGAALSEACASGEEEARPYGEPAATDGLVGLMAAAETMGPELSRAMAERFARGMEEGSGALALARTLGQLLSEDPRGATFVTMLAASLQAAGKPEAAHAVLCALCDGLDGVRVRFERAARTGRRLDRRLAKLIRRVGAKHGGESLHGLVGRYRAKHARDYAERERGAGDLGALLDGAGQVMELCRSEALTGEAATALMDRALVALGWTGEVLQTEAGQKLLGTAIDAQRCGRITFLDRLPLAFQVLGQSAGGDEAVLAVAGLDAEGVANGGTRTLRRLGEAVARWMMPQVAALFSSGNERTAVGLVLSTLTRNPTLFGLEGKRTAALGPALGRITAARTDTELRVAIGDVAALAPTDDAEGAEALKALAIGIGVPALLLNVRQSRVAPLAAVLRDLTGELVRGVGGIGVLGSLFSPPNPGPALAALLGNSRSSLPEQTQIARQRDVAEALAAGVAHRMRRSGMGRWSPRVIVAELTAPLSGLPMNVLTGVMLLLDSAAGQASSSARAA